MIANVITGVAAAAAFWVYVWSVLARERGWRFRWLYGVPILVLAAGCLVLRLGGFL